MASKEVKGLVIQIEGNSTGLVKSLKEVDAQLKKDEDALKRLDKALKLDPRNVDLVAAKEAVLADKTQLASQKMDILKKVQSDALNDLPQDAQLSASQMGELQSEIAKTAAELKEVDGEDIGDIKPSADKASDGVSKLEKESSKLGPALQKAGEMGVKALAAIGTAAVAGATAAAGAIGKLAVDVVQSYGDLEQSLGGSEAVFGSFAKTIQQEAEESYRTLGTSENQFLEYANKIGALYQGQGLSVEKSADLTTKAMRRAADMASVMGISTEDALNAVAGAAKNNYTMMDNLGVAMNKTVLEDYATSLGKVWKEMDQAEQAELAMEYFFTQTEKYAGNFENEASQTISGSLGMLSSSWQSFIAGLGSGDTDIANLAENIVSSFQTVATNIQPVLENLAANLPQALQSLLDGFSTILPGLLDSLSGIVVQLIDGLASVITNNLDTILDVISQVLDILVDTVIRLLPVIIPVAIEIINTLVNGLLAHLDQLIDAALQIINSLITALTQGDNITKLVNAAVTIVTRLATALLDSRNIKALVDGAKQLLLALVKGISTNLPTIIPAVVEAFSTLAMALTDPAFLTEMIGALVECLIVLADTIVENLPLFINSLVTIIGNLALTLIENFPLLIETALRLVGELIFMVFETIGTLLGFNLDEIFEIFQGAFDTICGIFEGIGDWFGDRWEDIKGVFSAVGEFFSGIFEDAWAMIKKPFDVTAKWFEDLWEDIKKPFAKVGEFFEGAFKTVGDIIKAPLNAVIDGINVVIGALNSLSIDIPSWVPGIGGDTWGIDIPKVPRLARGGVLEKGQVGLLEGSGAEAVVPLENNEGWIKATAAALKAQFDYSVATNSNIAQPIDYTSSFQMMADKITGLQQNGEEKAPPTFHLLVQLGQQKFAEMVAQAQADNTYYAGGY